jgi:2-polyprenyl-6-hydroxyphenyl methylase / 3-demethylubiquinone-9 3-methyltransferase
MMNTTLHPNEIEKFSALADMWWDTTGPFKSLHHFNPVRLKVIRRLVIEHFQRDDASLRPFDNLKILDIGCGGGLVTEPLARLGGVVTGIDGALKNIHVAKIHGGNLDILYLCTTAEEMVERGYTADVVLALEVIEHVDNVPLFLDRCRRLVAKGGVLIIATLNRTIPSLLCAKIAAEYILRWIPIGTHDFRKFLKPSDIILPLEKDGLRVKAMQGFSVNPVTQAWRETSSLAINYLLAFEEKF